MQRRRLLALPISLPLSLSIPALATMATPAGAAIDEIGARIVTLPPMLMPGLLRERGLSVMLPPDYERDSTRHPVLYVSDGQSAATNDDPAKPHWELDAIQRQRALAGQTTPIIVAVNNAGEKGRLTELNPWSNARYGRGEGVAYLRFIAETVKPEIDARFRTRPEREHTAIGGSSLGGFIALAALRAHADVFSVALALSPSIWIAPEIWPVMAAPWGAPSRVYLAIGAEEGEPHVGNLRRMAGLLKAHPQVDVALHVEPGAKHDAFYWRAEFKRAVQWWLGAS